MKNDDYGFYGKGLDGYVHYRQGMQEAARQGPKASREMHGMGPGAAGLSPQSRKQPSLHRNPTNPVRSASGSCSIRCIRRA